MEPSIELKSTVDRRVDGVRVRAVVIADDSVTIAIVPTVGDDPASEQAVNVRIERGKSGTPDRANVLDFAGQALLPGNQRAAIGMFAAATAELESGEGTMLDRAARVLLENGLISAARQPELRAGRDA